MTNRPRAVIFAIIIYGLIYIGIGAGRAAFYVAAIISAFVFLGLLFIIFLIEERGLSSERTVADIIDDDEYYEIEPEALFVLDVPQVIDGAVNVDGEEIYVDSIRWLFWIKSRTTRKINIIDTRLEHNYFLEKQEFQHWKAYKDDGAFEYEPIPAGYSEDLTGQKLETIGKRLG